MKPFKISYNAHKLKSVRVNEFLSKLKKSIKREGNEIMMNENVMRMGSYQVVSLVNAQGVEEKLFFAPVKCLKDEIKRRVRISQYSNAGFKVFATCNVNLETYLDLKIDYCVMQYISLDQQEREYKELHNNKPLEGWELESIEMLKELKFTELRKLALNMRRMRSHSFPVKNDIAVYLYDCWERIKKAV